MEKFLQELRERGYALLEKAGKPALDGAFARLGEVIHVTDVRNSPGARSLVASADGLDFHTDHPKADYIAWLCLEQSDSGGESILADAENAFARLSAEEQHALAEIRLLGHKVFSGDEGKCPLISVSDGRRRFYYSFWLAADDLPSAQKRALEQFRLAVSESQVAEVKLRKDDVLVVDNARIFHGRRAFEGRKRHLRRYWIRRFCSNTSQQGGKP